MERRSGCTESCHGLGTLQRAPGCERRGSGFLRVGENSWGTSKVSASLFSFSSAAVPLASELAVEILEKGEVRFWLQAEKLSGNAKANFVFNDKEIFNGEVSPSLLHVHEYQ